MDLLEKDRLIVAPGVYDANGSQAAKNIFLQRKEADELCSFNAVYGGGWAISAMLWGLPDFGFHSLEMMTMIGRYIIKQAYPLPVIFDAETGFGSPTTLVRCVENYHEIGVALGHMEDQDAEFTRRCGNLAGKKCVEPEVMIAKIRSWLRVSREINTSMRLMVRTDALTAAGCGLDNAIERGKRYMDVEYQGLRPAVLWADAMMDPDVIGKWVAAMRKHDPDMILGINYSPNKDWTGYYRKKFNEDPPTYEDLYDNGNGFRLIWHTILQARVNGEATYNAFAQMASEGPKVLWDLHERQRNHPVGHPQEMSNVKPWQKFEKAIGGDEAAKRYEKSQGYGEESK